MLHDIPYPAKSLITDIFDNRCKNGRTFCWTRPPKRLSGVGGFNELQRLSLMLVEALLLLPFKKAPLVFEAGDFLTAHFLVCRFLSLSAAKPKKSNKDREYFVVRKQGDYRHAWRA